MVDFPKLVQMESGDKRGREREGGGSLSFEGGGGREGETYDFSNSEAKTGKSDWIIYLFYSNLSVYVS